MYPQDNPFNKAGSILCTEDRELGWRREGRKRSAAEDLGEKYQYFLLGCLNLLEPTGPRNLLLLKKGSSLFHRKTTLRTSRVSRRLKVS